MGFAEEIMAGVEERIVASQMLFSGTGVITEVAGDLLTAQVTVTGGTSAIPMMVASTVIPVAGERCGYVQFIVPKRTRPGKPNEGGSEYVVIAMLGDRPNLAWVKPTLQNLWTNRAGAFPNMQYRIGPTSHRVEMIGQIVPGTLADGTVLFNLPVGFRPVWQVILLATDAANAVCRIIVETNGDVKIFDAAGSTLVQIPLLSFPVDGAV